MLNIGKVASVVNDGYFTFMQCDSHALFAEYWIQQLVPREQPC